MRRERGEKQLSAKSLRSHDQASSQLDWGGERSRPALMQTFPPHWRYGWKGGHRLAMRLEVALQQERRFPQLKLFPLCLLGHAIRLGVETGDFVVASGPPSAVGRIRKQLI
jgi:hypothetical protein